MQRDSSEFNETVNETRDILKKITFLIGNADIIVEMQELPVLEPFHRNILDFLNDVSRQLMSNREAKLYPDVVTLAFWMRLASTLKMKNQFQRADENIRMGRGTVFHIAPSNVPVNFVYSLVSGLLTGNANIVRVPSKDFPQIEIICQAFRIALEMNTNKYLKKYICLIRYGREQEVNDWLSSVADMRIVWGGDATITELRKSPLAPRAGEITFADRFSLAVIDSETYLMREEKERIAEEFYNDTYLTDQNACTSPHLVVWMGEKKQTAKKIFWDNLHALVKEKYNFQAIQGVNKLSSCYLAAVIMANVKNTGTSRDKFCSGVKVEEHEDNLLVRVEIPKPTKELIELRDNSGYFFEYDCDNILDLRELCNDEHCQTVAYIGDKEMLKPLLLSGIKGIDRIVPVGKTMEFNLIWDGYNLYERLTRTVQMQ